MRLTFVFMNYLEFSLILETWLTLFPSSENAFQVSSTGPLGRMMFYGMFYSEEVVWYHHLKFQINKSPVTSKSEINKFLLCKGR